MKNVDKLILEGIFEGRFSEVSTTIREEAMKNNIIPASLFEVYRKIASGESGGFTVPAFNLRTLTYDFARAIFRSAKKAKAGLFIFELARQEKEYTNQDFNEYVTCILSAALREEFFYPVFIQADHVQLSRKKFFESKDEELSSVKNLIREAITAGVYNIDIDASTLVEADKNSEIEQQRNNFKITAELIKFIREIEPQFLTVNIGGEIGEIGKRNSTKEDLCAYMDGLKGEIEKDMPSITKISIQTGTTHGGVVLPDGRIAEVEVDFETIKELSQISREKYGLAGVVQHGASTLPLELFHRFPENNCIEIHLATGIQNMFFDSGVLPEELLRKMEDFLITNYSEEIKKYSTHEQFIYKTRKYALGRFKREIWTLPQEHRDKLAGIVEEWALKIFNLLKVNETIFLLKKH